MAQCDHEWGPVTVELDMEAVGWVVQSRYCLLCPMVEAQWVTAADLEALGCYPESPPGRA